MSALRIYVNPDLFKEALRRGKYEYWTPFFDSQTVGDKAALIESVGHRVLSSELDMVCLDIKRNKDGYWTVVWGLCCGPMNL